ncbi:MAG TPA: polysaccharide biosynthesis tyrosine autokinase [Chitinispirillaceae bacterium]|nr:polysaccharide biosynthesis tyrosine autokinase [Chitinispirillaceae bacterium]
MKRQLDHYVHLIWRRLWFILPTCLLVSAAWFVAINKLGVVKPQLSATAILHFEDPDEGNAIDERVSLGPEAKAVLVKSRSFLEKVVRKLALQLRVSKYPRSMIFDSLAVQIDADPGVYQLKICKNNYKLYFTDRSGHKKIIHSADISSLSHISIPGVYMRFSKNFLSAPFNVKFQVTRLRDAIDYIVDNMITKTASRDGTVMSISLNGRDYEMITSIINTVADDFASENTLTKHNRIGDLISVLDTQLKAARKDMLQAETALKSYRDKHPTIGLANAFAPPVALMDLRETESELKSAVFQVQNLMERYSTTVDSNRLALLNEMVSFLTRFQTGTAQGLSIELSKLEQENARLTQQYAPNHMFINKNMENIRIFGRDVQNALGSLSNDLNRKIDQNKTRINKLNSEIASLPAKELYLSKLQRNYDITAEIYVNVLNRYNEAQLAHTIEVGDVYVVDHGVVPEPKMNFKTFLVIVGLGLFLSFALGLGPVLAMDYFDGTARTEKDLKAMTDLTVLESIPVKGRWSKSASFGKSIDEKLIAADYSHNFADETFRSLRAKVLLGLNDIKKKRILITSLGIGEGKSFTAANLAITLAQQRISTLLIDGDLRRGVQHQHFGLPKSPGLSSILLDSSSLSPILLQPVLQSTHIQYLKLLGAGSTIINSSEHINSLRFRSLIDMLSNEFEVIILDTPPVAVTTDAIGVQDIFHRYIFVVRAMHTDIAELNRKIQEFPGLRKRVLGIVLNGAPYKHTEYYQYTSYKYEID